MQVGKQYPVRGKDYFYKILTIGEKTGWLDTYPYRDIELFEALDEFENREKKYTEPQKNCVESQKNT